MILVRHGEGSWNRLFHDCRIDAAVHDPVLTGRGREQAAIVAGKLAREGVVRVITSPYRRSLETASIIADRLGLDITVDPLVRERCAFSCDQGSPPSLLAEEWPSIDFSGLDEIWWGRRIESQASIERRVAQFTRAMTRQADWRQVVVVSHWGFIRASTGEVLDNAELVHWIPAVHRTDI